MRVTNKRVVACPNPLCEDGKVYAEGKWMKCQVCKGSANIPLEHYVTIRKAAIQSNRVA